MSWTFDLSDDARQDIKLILKRTLREFGSAARYRYNELIFQSLKDIASNPDGLHSRIRTAGGIDYLTYHIRHSQENARTNTGIVKEPRHLIFYVKQDGKNLEIVRILHERMDFARHLPEE